MTETMSNKKKKGFTLVELLVVIAILAILVTVTIIGYTEFIKRARESNAEAEAAQIETVLQGHAALRDEVELSTDKKLKFGFDETNNAVTLKYIYTGTDTSVPALDDATFKNAFSDFEDFKGIFTFALGTGSTSDSVHTTPIESITYTIEGVEPQVITIADLFPYHAAPAAPATTE